MSNSGWYDTRWGRGLYWGAVVATLVGVVVSTNSGLLEISIPPGIYLFGFLGATVYVFTSFAKRFDEGGRYRLKILSRTVAVLPLAAGVYLLAFAFPGVVQSSAQGAGTGGIDGRDRLAAGLVFLAGIYVSTTLKALGGLAERLLGVGSERAEESGDERDDGDDERDDGDDTGSRVAEE